MKLLFLTPSSHLGGAEQILCDILEGLRVDRPEWNLGLIAANEGILTERASELGIKTCILKFPSNIAVIGESGTGFKKSTILKALFAVPEYMEYTRRLREFICNFQPHLIHSNGFKMHLFASRAKPSTTRLIWHLHDFMKSRPAISRLLRLHVKRCDLAIANSTAVAHDFREYCSNGARIATVLNAVDIRRFTPQGKQLNLDVLCGLNPASFGTVRVGLVATMA